jgi:transposase-like protein
MSARTISYKNHRFPPQIIAHAVWLYFWFPLSLRLAEEMLLERSIVVSYETIRRWGRKFGAAYAKQLRRKRPSRPRHPHPSDPRYAAVEGRDRRSSLSLTESVSSDLSRRKSDSVCTCPLGGLWHA